MMEHVYEKVVGYTSDAGTQAADSGVALQERVADQNLSAQVEGRIQLLCCDKVSDCVLFPVPSNTHSHIYIYS